MPRINIEEKWWSDPRRSMLIIKLGLEADAAMLNAIKLSQDFNGELFDPSGVLPDHWVDALLSVGLATANQTLDGRLIYIKGSKEHHEWIKSQRERGKLGGNKSAKLRQATAQPLPSNGLAIGQPSSSSSSSTSNKNTNTKEKTKAQGKLEPDRDLSFQEGYKDYPNKEGKTPGYKKYLKDVKSDEDYQAWLLAIKNYGLIEKNKGTEKKYIKHFATFMNCWRDYVHISDDSNLPMIEKYAEYFKDGYVEHE